MDAVQRQLLHLDDVSSRRDDDLDALLLHLTDRIDGTFRYLAGLVGKQRPVDIEEDDLDVLFRIVRTFDVEHVGETGHVKDFEHVIIHVDDRKSAPVADLLFGRKKSPQTGRRDVFGLLQVDDQIGILIDRFQQRFLEFRRGQGVDPAEGAQDQDIFVFESFDLHKSVLNNSSADCFSSLPQIHTGSYTPL